jgi:hypothetical protein
VGLNATTRPQDLRATSACLSYDPALVDLIKEHPMPRTPRASSFLLASAAASIFVVSAHLDAQRASQGVVVPDDPIWAVQEPQEPPPAPGPAPAQGDGDAAAAGRGRGATPPAQPRPYEQVITSEARTDDGVFKVHRVREQLFYEIPKTELGREFLWVSQIKSNSAGNLGGMAAGNRVVRWDLVGNRVLLRLLDFGIVADASNPISRAVAAANNPAIMRAFNVAAFSKAGDPVIEVTPLFLSEIPELSVRGRIGGRGFDQARTFLEKAVSFPENINVEVNQTYTAPLDAGGGRGDAPAPAARGGMRGNSATVVVAYSMVRLPDKPMMPRLFDERVGYFNRSEYDYGRSDHRALQRTFILRYRLEKRDPAAEISEPIKPIVYYVDPATPKQWVQYVKKGIEDWQPAFEAAGFRRAIIAREAPTDDPDWSPEDARYSVIRWLPSTTENASGPNINDPRTGEILEADIQFHHNVQNLLKNWYFVQVGPLDPRASRLPLPDDLMGELIRYVVAHEVGHTLGFQHNMKASGTYSVAQVRDKQWVKTNSHTPTLMDYSRFNYVAQPEDGIDAADLIPKIGPYDRWATMWGYKPIPGAHTPDDEKPTLDAWARQQDATPWLRFSTAQSGNTDPQNQSEAVGDADAVQATRLGLKNLERVSGMLLTATTTKPGDPYRELTEVYGRVLAQWTLEMNHIVPLIGGFLSQQRHIGQQGVRFTPVPRAKQIEATQFLLNNAFAVPAFLVQPDLLRRIEPVGVMNRVRSAQASVLNGLLATDRIARVAEQNAIDGPNTYSAVQFLKDVRSGIWSELTTPARPISAYRRNTQRLYLDTLDNRLNDSTPDAEVRSLLRGELRALRGQVVAALPAMTDRASRLHLEDARDLIDEILDPRAMRQRGGTGRAAGAGPAAGIQQSPAAWTFDFAADPFWQQTDRCWVDYAL